MKSYKQYYRDRKRPLRRKLAMSEGALDCYKDALTNSMNAQEKAFNELIDLEKKVKQGQMTLV